MNELLVIGALVVVLAGCFALVRRARRNDTGGSKTYWVINPNQQGRKKAYTGYSLTRPQGKYRIPLSVTEAPDEFEKTPKRKRSTRYFERD